ncbi:hypothetical protein [Nocardia amamiensis]|uniref:hypothetical protein n=1 Tax=Nocardia amamiensis TaxID=404578 RepID=UPI000836A124|nr:hypothetical protein [Nocardia amamiensis]
MAAAPTPVAAKSCDFTTYFGKPTLLHPVISTDAKVSCHVPPESHTLELSLEHFQTGQWVRWALQVDSKIPSRSGHEVRVSAECDRGDWRHRVHVYGKLQGRPFDYTEVGDTRKVSSDECPRG